MLKTKENNLAIALKNNHESYLKKIHMYMNQMYYNMMFSEVETNLYDVENIKKLKSAESVWIAHEKNRCLNQFDCDHKVQDTAIVESALRNHPVHNHRLFDYLLYEANMDDLKKFILSESVLNLEFFDYLALSIIGTADDAKCEIATNLWDEAGKGNVQQFHTTMFKKMMEEMGLKYARNMIVDSMPWEGVAGINLFSYFSLYSYNKMKYFGLLAATEMLDPPHYNKLIKGIYRILGKQKINQSYYVEHETIDVAHADGWLQKIILPELAKKPNKTREFWLGFYMRLNSAQRYYDRLLDVLIAKKAA